MMSCDVNVLVYAHNVDAPRHAEYEKWLEDALEGPEPFGVSTQVLSGFIRIATHPGILTNPYSAVEAVEAATRVRSAPSAVKLGPGPQHWSIFTELCRVSNAKGNLVADAYLAALAIEHRCEWNTTDQDFARFPGLRWRHPLDH
jgi:toxin-antitoxin system PIN domain toxin